MALNGVFWKPSVAAGIGPSLVSLRHNSWVSAQPPPRSWLSSSATGGSVGIQPRPSLPPQPSKRPQRRQPPSLRRPTCRPPNPHRLTFRPRSPIPSPSLSTWPQGRSPGGAGRHRPLSSDWDRPLRRAGRRRAMPCRPGTIWLPQKRRHSGQKSLPAADVHKAHYLRARPLAPKMSQG
jgi:hypothetical protein